MENINSFLNQMVSGLEGFSKELQKNLDKKFQEMPKHEAEQFKTVLSNNDTLKQVAENIAKLNSRK